MKIFPLFLLTVLTGSGFAQCVTDVPSNAEGVYPITLAEGTLQTQYNDTLTIVYPFDTLVSGFVFPFDSFRVDMVNNLPDGLNWLCNDAPNCFAIAPGAPNPAKQCIIIMGIPTTIPVNDTIELSITAWLTVGGIGSQSFGGNILKVELPMSSTAVGVDNPQNIEVSVYPNPSNGLVSIRLTERFENMRAEVKNVVGQVVETYTFKNTNLFALELPKQEGLYLIELSTPDGLSATLKVIRE
ncbi:MAG: hypothetical protein ACI85F_000095 [Bacteroidia bacterium]|jgi:hypothetical protein